MRGKGHGCSVEEIGNERVETFFDPLALVVARDETRTGEKRWKDPFLFLGGEMFFHRTEEKRQLKRRGGEEEE